MARKNVIIAARFHSVPDAPVWYVKGRARDNHADWTQDRDRAMPLTKCEADEKLHRWRIALYTTFEFWAEQA